MKRIALYLLMPLLASSCMDYNTMQAVRTPSGKVALQDFYSPCCGSCGQRIVLDNNKEKKLYALQSNCNIQDEYSLMCTPHKLGAQKQVITYRKKKVLSATYYKPVYDTVELKKQYPKANVTEYADTLFAGKPIIPLNGTDSFLIRQYFALTSKRDCADKYLHLIRGFIFVTEGSPVDRKKVKFKLSRRVRRSNAAIKK